MPQECATKAANQRAKDELTLHPLESPRTWPNLLAERQNVFWKDYSVIVAAGTPAGIKAHEAGARNAADLAGRLLSYHAENHLEAVKFRSDKLESGMWRDAFRNGLSFHAANLPEWIPHGQGFIAATNMKREGNVSDPAAREMVTSPSSIGWRF